MESYKYSFNNSIGRLSREIVFGLGHIMKTEFTNEGFSLRPLEWVGLGYVYQNDGLSQNQLSELLGENKVTIKRIVDSLENKNYVIRKTVRNDKRFNSLVITKAGQEVFDQLSKIAAQILEQSLQDVKEEEFATYLKVSEKIVTNIKNLK